ncbi:ABC-2 type transport system permease protein [Leucobacter exalbidus]|uniref:ABC-2 type transport system permease protein n=1 Tax=Leucobacter exalbidus TaxID=662960 RepID=A0A940PTI3_9MICO|nr:ABC transporter permease [Leucobacter exalbidus]MBP1324951.1 ABC-2 type transport system permease protein [Leucobacter exalbidus]
MTTTLVIDGSKVPGEASPTPPRKVTPGTAVMGAKLSFGGMLRSERIKLSSLRSVKATLLCTLVAGLGLGALIAVLWNAENDLAAASASDLNTYLLLSGTTAAPFLGLIFGVLGVLVMSSEYASGLIQSTLVAAPRRMPVFLAKAAVLAVGAALTALLIVGGSMGVATLIFPGAAAQFMTPQIISAVLGTVGYLVLLALFAYGVATLTRNAAASIGIVAGVTFVAPIALSIMSMTGWDWVYTVMDYLPMTLGNTLAQGILPADQMGSGLDYWGALCAIAVWAIVTVVPGAILFTKRDAR